jgi:hypothetical protein
MLRWWVSPTPEPSDLPAGTELIAKGKPDATASRIPHVGANLVLIQYADVHSFDALPDRRKGIGVKDSVSPELDGLLWEAAVTPQSSRVPGGGSWLMVKSNLNQ